MAQKKRSIGGGASAVQVLLEEAGVPTEYVDFTDPRVVNAAYKLGEHTRRANTAARATAEIDAEMPPMIPQEMFDSGVLGRNADVNRSRQFVGGRRIYNEKQPWSPGINIANAPAFQPEHDFGRDPDASDAAQGGFAEWKAWKDAQETPDPNTIAPSPAEKYIKPDIDHDKSWLGPIKERVGPIIDSIMGDRYFTPPGQPVEKYYKPTSAANMLLGDQLPYPVSVAGNAIKAGALGGLVIDQIARSGAALPVAMAGHGLDVVTGKPAGTSSHHMTPKAMWSDDGKPVVSGQTAGTPASLAEPPGSTVGTPQVLAQQQAANVLLGAPQEESPWRQAGRERFGDAYDQIFGDARMEREARKGRLQGMPAGAAWGAANQNALMRGVGINPTSPMVAQGGGDSLTPMQALVMGGPGAFGAVLNQEAALANAAAERERWAGVTGLDRSRMENEQRQRIEETVLARQRELEAQGMPREQARSQAIEDVPGARGVVVSPVSSTTFDPNYERWAGLHAQSSGDTKAFIDSIDSTMLADPSAVESLRKFIETKIGLPAFADAIQSPDLFGSVSSIQNRKKIAQALGIRPQQFGPLEWLF